MHDLATLLVYATLWDGEPGADDDLLAYARRHAAPGKFEISLAARLLDVLGFLVRHHPEDGHRHVGAATELLGRLS